jgi:GTP-binding protein EngB required for normal cell division
VVATLSTNTRSPIDLAAELIERYRILSLGPLIESCRAFERETTLNIAVFGRFKAGKSSFLNAVLGLDLLPVGVVPVTAIVTEIGYGGVERVVVHYLDGTAAEIALRDIGDYIDEARNPENAKNVARVRVELPSLTRFRGIRFVDTPGLESVLTHNTEASRDWLPNVGLALVAVAVDPPLSQKDVELIRDLHRYTPNVSILLTKVDILGEKQRREVHEYVRSQLDRYLDDPIPIFAYSIRAGFESLRDVFERQLIHDTQTRAAAHREIILNRKLETLLSECGEYLKVALKSAEAAESDRRLLRDRILGERAVVDDLKLALRLKVKHAVSNTRTLNEKILGRHEQRLNDSLLRDFDVRFAQWTSSLKEAAAMFEEWLQSAMTEKMSALSAEHRQDFVEPIHVVGRQLSQSLQDFRNRISEAMIAALGVPLRTTEVEIEIEPPRSPDVRIGKIFDRNWELISFLLPMTLVKGILKQHFRGKIRDVVFKNLSRLAFQWEEIVNAGLVRMEKESLLRVDNLIATIEHLVNSSPQETLVIQKDLATLDRALLILRSR